MSGFFITIEGGEGAGKSTLIQALTAYFEEQQIKFIATREPGGSDLAEKIRELLLLDLASEMQALTELLLMFASRNQHIQERILPALKADMIVLCDRFTDSSYAYQGAGRELGFHTVAKLEQLVHPELQPNLTLLLDLPVTLGQQRKQGDVADRIEQESVVFFERVREGYLLRAQAEPERFIILDASLAPDILFKRTLSEIKNRIKS